MIPLPKNTIDEAGHEYGWLRVIEYAGVSAWRNALWLCECRCGVRKVVSSKRLRNERTVSCGCYRANPEIRRAARMKVSAKRRRAIAKMGAAARLVE
jgi:hypothetical protein